MIFGRKLAPRCALKIASELRKEVAKRDSLKSRNFSIISHRESILPLYLAWIVAITMATIDITRLIINYWREEFIT